MNVAIISGRLTEDPQIRGQGGTVAAFGVATNEFRNGQQETEFHNCVAFGKTVEVVRKAQKGSSVEIVGRLQTKPYTNRAGVEVKRTEIVVDRFNFGDRGRRSEEPAYVASPHGEDVDPSLGW